MLVTLSIPKSKHIAYIKSSIIDGAYTLFTVQYINTNIITKKPNTPHTLLEDIPECEVTIYLINVVIFFII
jgi:hypothetical protein